MHTNRPTDTVTYRVRASDPKRNGDFKEEKGRQTGGKRWTETDKGRLVKKK